MTFFVSSSWAFRKVYTFSLGLFLIFFVPGLAHSQPIDLLTRTVLSKTFHWECSKSYENDMGWDYYKNYFSPRKSNRQKFVIETRFATDENQKIHSLWQGPITELEARDKQQGYETELIEYGGVPLLYINLPHYRIEVQWEWNKEKKYWVDQYISIRGYKNQFIGHCWSRG